MWFFISNIVFILCNLPLLLFLFLFERSDINNYTLLFSICLLPLAPALTALMYTMNRLIALKSISVLKDYFRSYRLNFLQAIKTGSIQIILVLSLITYLNKAHNMSHGYLITPFLYVLLFLILMMSLYIYPILAKFHIKVIDAYKAALILTITKPVNTFTNLLILMFGIILFEVRASVAILFIASVICYLLMYSQKRIFQTLESSRQSHSS